MSVAGLPKVKLPGSRTAPGPRNATWGSVAKPTVVTGLTARGEKSPKLSIREWPSKSKSAGGGDAARLSGVEIPVATSLPAGWSDMPSGSRYQAETSAPAALAEVLSADMGAGGALSLWAVGVGEPAAAGAAAASPGPSALDSATLESSETPRRSALEDWLGTGDEGPSTPSAGAGTGDLLLAGTGKNAAKAGFEGLSLAGLDDASLSSDAECCNGGPSAAAPAGTTAEAAVLAACGDELISRRGSSCCCCFCCAVLATRPALTSAAGTSAGFDEALILGTSCGTCGEVDDAASAGLTAEAAVLTVSAKPAQSPSWMVCFARSFGSAVMYGRGSWLG